MSFAEENYLKTIFALEASTTLPVSTNEIAKKLDAKASSVTDMLKKLSDKGYVIYKKYQPARLTEKGRALALNVIRKHRLWEYFLVEKLNFGWEEVHDIAEQLEHIQSKELTSRLEKFLGYPKYDPHGDPIPDQNGKMENILDSVLLNIKEGQKVKVMGVKIHNKAFLKYLDKMGIGLGSEIEVQEKQDFDQSIKVNIDGEKPAYISSEVSKNILIQHL